MSDKFDDLVAYVAANRRVCPLPMPWAKLYHLLPNTRRVGLGYEPSAPLILGGWDSADSEKRLRLLEHIEWAHRHRALDVVDSYLRGLPEKDWLHLGD